MNNVIVDSLSVTSPMSMYGDLIYFNILRMYSSSLSAMPYAGYSAVSLFAAVSAVDIANL